MTQGDIDHALSFEMPLPQLGENPISARNIGVLDNSIGDCPSTMNK